MSVLPLFTPTVVQRETNAMPSMSSGKAQAAAPSYVDADDRQSAWHADPAKARRFATYDSADDLLHILLNGNGLPAAADDYDTLPA
ncbi:hypothetical protein [Rhizobium sp. CSW-27]|uniref:hypothetical protein n=1 Tax=Rhizobium sp. CSW-27 TaxID=2839985 RepID=UPI001C021B3C|nr:hypothetical protein [Rhizobium sp. CSW-27]MBT9371344.1 hypothetical protein [Rhizobium sp. CSW-27]